MPILYTQEYANLYSYVIYGLFIMTQVLPQRPRPAATVLSRQWRVARRVRTAAGALPRAPDTAVRSAAAVGGGECEAA